MTEPLENGADWAYLAHIRDALDRIQRYTSGGREVFLEDARTQDAVIRNLEVIGEAVKGLSERTKARAPDLPWRAIAGMRDRLIHGYFGVDLAIVWAVVERDLPPLRAEVDRLLAGRSG